MEKLIELIEQWEDINQGLNDKELLSLSVKLRDLEDEVFQAMQNRIQDKRAATKYLELYRYYCEECGVSFKIDYEDGGVINFCPFCGTEEYGDKGHTDSIVFDGLFEYYAEEPGKLEGQHFLALSILVKALETLKTE